MTARARNERNRSPGAIGRRRTASVVDKIDIETRSTRVSSTPPRTSRELRRRAGRQLLAVLFTRESPTTIPDVWLKDVAANTTKKITNNVDVGPQVSGAQLNASR